MYATYVAVILVVGPDPMSTLRRALGPGLLTVLVVGDILGAGIYILVGEVAADVGGMVWLPFLAAFVLAAVTAASYSELVAEHPHAAGSAHYVDLAYGRPVLTFMVGFVVAASAVSTGAAVSRAVGGQYLQVFFDAPVVPVALVTIALLSVLTWVGISESARANAVMTVVEVGGLALVIAAGVLGFVDGSADPARLLDPGTADPGAGVLLAAVALAFFAYLGFEDVVHLSEEVRDPQRAFPRALFGGLAAVGLLYLGVTISVASLVDPDALASSSTPLLAALDGGPLSVPGELFAAIAIVAVTNTTLMAVTTASRQVYGLAEKGSVPGVLGRVGRRETPTVAIGAVAVVVGIMAATGDVRALADTTVVLLLAVFATVNVTVLVLRRRSPEVVPPARRRVPALLPAAGALASAVLCGDALVRGGVGLWVRVVGLLGLGLVLYGLSRIARTSARPPG